MTAEEFSRDENNRAQLQKLLDSPILKAALDLLADELQPTPGNEGVGNPVVGAARFQQIAGANHMLKGLKRLAAPPRPKPESAARPPLRKEVVNPSL